MSHRAFGVLLLLVALALAAPTAMTSAASGPMGARRAAPATLARSVPPPPVTIAGANDFVPDRDLSDCISALPEPDCGSSSRGDWRQWVVLLVVAAGLSFIGWRIVRGARRNRQDARVGDDA